MRIYHNNTRVVYAVWDRNKLDQTADYPYIDIDETINNLVVLKSVLASILIEEDQSGYTVVNNQLYYQNILVSIELDPERVNKAQALVDAANLGNWWTWTQTQFVSWCDSNLMTDAAIDALTLNAQLKTNIKAINLFVRNAGKLLIAIRDVIKWVVKQL